MSKQKRTMLVTSALPYANGDIHLGHLVGYIQTDIWVRWQKMQGHQCVYVCGCDAHGTPIMIKAEQMQISPEQLVSDVRERHQADFAGFLVEFDNYYTTHSAESRHIAETIYQRLKAQGDIVKRTIRQAYDPVKAMFLPDRYVKGECPRCHAADQYGDNCEACGATYSPTDLINPTSVLTGATPIQKESEHCFFQLQNHTELLKKWTQNGHLQPQIENKLQEWFEEGLREWDISRDAPYFGFEIPDEPGKYFYVWLDAPMGYMASFQQLCDQRDDLNFADYWGKDSTHELYHFIGKDIIYFHSLFWLAILAAADFRTPTAIYVNGFLTVNGQKMSKSRGTFIQARDYLQHLNPEYLRYYFAAKLNSHVEDIDLNLSDFSQRINADLVGKVVNIASRCAKFINKHFANRLSASVIDNNLLQHFVAASTSIGECYEHREFAKAMRTIMELADKANQFIDEYKPWVAIKQPGQEQQVQQVCSLGLNLFRLLMVYLKPVLPQLATEVEHFLQIPALTWDDKAPLLDHEIAQFKPLMQRVTQQAIDELMQPTSTAS